MKFLFLKIIPYLEPWRKNPKYSRTFDVMSKYLPEKTPLCTKRRIFSVNLYAANKTPAPCSKRRGVKRTGIEICLATDGLP